MKYNSFGIHLKNHIKSLGTTTTTASNGEGEEMIVSDANHGQEGQYVSFQMPDGSSQRGTLVLAHDGNGENQGQEGYIVVTAQEDAKVRL